MDNMLIPQPSDVTKIKGYYIIEGYKFPRVTSIIRVINKPALLRWYGTMGTAKAEEYTNERADFGTQLHKNIEGLVQLEDSEIDVEEIIQRYKSEEMQGCIGAWLDWRHGKIFGKRQKEVLLFSRKYGYAGTCDFYGDVDDMMLLSDWKTAKNVYLDYFLQMSAYAEAILEMTGKYPDRAGVLAVHGDRKYIYKWIGPDILRSFFPIFMACKQIYQWQGRGWEAYFHFEKSGDKPDKPSMICARDDPQGRWVKCQ